jgi:DNA (cytosine-5)-methyltransferase 1
MIKVGSDFSGVGAFNQALKRLGIEYKELFACDMDKYARSTFIHNYGEPEYYPTNVYERYIPAESLDIYMTSPPCQAFSLAGKRLGKNDKRGILFFNSLEFIKVNKPRYFIFENVKGLLSDDNGNTFAEWVALLGGKSVNGSPLIFSFEDSVPYHLYWSVLNAKDYGVPQNRERVFLIGIRDDRDNNFRFPKEERLTKSLKDVLEDDVDSKYFLSTVTINKLIDYDKRNKQNGNGFGAKFHGQDEIMSALKVGGGGCDDLVKVGTWRTHEDGRGFREIEDGNCPTIPARAREDGSGQPVIQYNDKRLNETIAKNTLPIGKAMVIDTYNQSIYEECPTLKKHHAENGDRKLWDGYKIRRLTPRECFRLMDFPDTFTWTCSDSQAYKQAGNSIVVSVLAKIINNLKLS